MDERERVHSSRARRSDTRAPVRRDVLRPGRGAGTLRCLAIGAAAAWWLLTGFPARADDATAAESTMSAPAAPETDVKPSFFHWTDTSVTLLPWGWGYRVDPDEQSTLTLEHAHASAIGDLFLFLDITKFHDSDGDQVTWYGEVGPRLSVGKLLGKDLSFTVFRRSLFEFKDVLFAAQYERGEDADTAEAALVGVGFDLDVREAGLLGLLGKFQYVQLNLYARAELTEGVERGFEDMQITMTAGYPFEIGSARFLVDGYFDWVLGIGAEQSSFHLNPQLKLDVGHFWGKPEMLYAGVELDFWWDKYQIDDTSGFDTDQQAVSLLLKYHF
jgi:nucleoside-specific outer membrane channel protein Tsx